ncbi:uncharacterized protein [Gossypium hirsutum]|uniref:Retrotransposon gag domain-containing protein n=1 Tax=Gossypium hirsutum TaxID=3635 RepID=A0A1U8N087_GOSHI|nr:uncharacterized protein LOC107943273 [Gossypium hirsutum]
MLRILEKVARPGIGNLGRGSVTERLRSNGAKIFRGIVRVAPNVAEYWMEATERILDNLDCTPDQKLKGVVPLLRDEAYQWWLTVKEGTQANHLTWMFFKTTFQAKYVGASYIDACRREFLNLTQGDRTVAEYEAEFLRLSLYAHGMVATKYERCVRFEDGLKDGLRVLIAPQRERDFATLVDEAKIAEDVRGLSTRIERKAERLRKNPRTDGPTRLRAPVATVGPQFCIAYEERHQGECWRKLGACLRCESLESRVKDCPWRPDQMQATGMGTGQPSRGV